MHYEHNPSTSTNASRLQDSLFQNETNMSISLHSSGKGLDDVTTYRNNSIFLQCLIQSLWSERTYKKSILICIVSVLVSLLSAIIVPIVLLLLLRSDVHNIPPTSSVARTYTNHCQGISSYTLWTNYSANIITMKINTTKCAFRQTPIYFTSIIGSSNHWYAYGFGAIYQATTESFQIYIRSFETSNAAQILSWSQTFRWSVDWIGAIIEKRTYSL